MKRSLTIWIILSLMSCTFDSMSDAEKINDIYEFRDVEYYIGEGDGMNTVEKYQPLIVYYNKTGTTAVFETDPSKELSHYSMFTCDSKLDYNFLDVDEHNMVYVPQNVENNTITLGDERWNYNMSVFEKHPYEDEVGLTTYHIEPYTTLIIRCKVEMDVINTSYTAVFRGINAGNDIKVQGRWQGNRIKKTYVEEKYVPIE